MVQKRCLQDFPVAHLSVPLFMNNEKENYGINLSELTDDEIEMMRCIAKGNSNNVIAEKFNISPNTVKVRVSKLTEKLNAQDRIQVAVIAAKCNLV